MQGPPEDPSNFLPAPAAAPPLARFERNALRIGLYIALLVAIRELAWNVGSSEVRHLQFSTVMIVSLAALALIAWRPR